MNPVRRYIPGFLFLLPFIFFGSPNSLSAQALILSTSKSSYTTNDSILVSATVQTGGQPINTVGGKVNFPVSSVTVSDVRFGNSIISLWVEKPAANNSAGTISFTGGTPGGFSGSTGPLFTFVVKAKKAGPVTISLSDVHVLLNDGSGAEIAGLKTPSLNLNITQAPKPVTPPPTPQVPEVTPVVEEPVPVAIQDTVSPETFVPIVSRDKSIFENSYFVSFNAVDKDSGVARYEVREIPKIISIFTDIFNTEWKEAASPYLLHFQSWGSTVEVRAIDGAGNRIVSRTDKPFGMVPIVVLVAFLILFSIVTTYLLTKRAKPLRRKIRV